MLFNHDATRPLDVKILDAKVVALEDGEFALDATLEAEADAWATVQAEWARAGVRGGMSFTATSPQAGPQSGGTAQIVLAADAAAWSDEDRAAAAALLDAVVPTQVDRLFQFSAVELATVYLVLGNVALGVLGNAAYDAIRRLFRGRTASTRLEIQRTDRNGATVKAIVETDDAEVAVAAIEQLAPTQRAAVIRYEVPKRLWLDD
jgi:hypothetical protein